MTPSPPARVLAIALSEVPWTFIRDPSMTTRLTRLTRMVSEGASGTTLASQPLDSLALWATLATGRSAGAHGIFGSCRRDGDRSFRPVSPRDLAAVPIWQLLEDAGLPVGAFNLSLEDPTRPVRGFTVSRDARPEIHPGLVQPAELYPRLIERFGQWTTTTKAKTRPEWTSLVPRESEIRTDVLAELLRTRPWNFALAQIQELAFVQHRFWSDATDTLRHLYATVDRAIAKLMDAAGPDTIVFVFSECGAGPIRHGVHLNTWLEQQGYLHRRHGPVQGLGLSIARAHRRVRRFLPQRFDLSRFKMRVRSAIAASTIDWSRTRAHSPGDTNEILFNVPASDHATLTDDLCARLRAWRDPEGRRVVEDVIPRAAWGSRWDFAPDLTIVWEDDAYMPTETFDESGQAFVDWCPQFPDWTFTGSHRREGMLMVTGPGIERTDLGTVRTLDLVPTWLDLLGVGIPAELEGSSFADRL